MSEFGCPNPHPMPASRRPVVFSTYDPDEAVGEERPHPTPSPAHSVRSTAAVGAVLEWLRSREVPSG